MLAKVTHYIDVSKWHLENHCYPCVCGNMATSFDALSNEPTCEKCRMVKNSFCHR